MHGSTEDSCATTRCYADRGASGCVVWLERFYTMDITHKAILEKDVDVEALARKVGALKDRETVAEA